MIKNLHRLGTAMQADESYDVFFTPWGNPFAKGDIEKAKVLYFNIQDGLVQGGYEIEPFKPKLLKAYLYRKPSGANGAPLVPTSPFYPTQKAGDHKAGVEKLMGRMERSFPKGVSLYFPSDGHRKAALAHVEESLRTFDGDFGNRYLLTFKVDGKWLGDFEENVELLYSEAYNKYSEKSMAEDHLCSVTYRMSPKVWGRVDTLGFTVDTPTFSRSGFSGKGSYRMFPVSPDAVKVLEGAKRFALEKLTRSFYSLKYFIVPHFIEEGQDGLILGSLNGLVDAVSQNASNHGETILNNEKVIAVLAEDSGVSKAGIFYDIFFFEENQAQFSIKLHLADLMPSRFRRVFEAKRKIEKRFSRINRIFTKKNGEEEFSLTFKTIQRYFSSVVKKETVFHPYFFNVLEAVFQGGNLNEETVMDAFMAQIRVDFKQRHESPTSYIFHTKEAFALWHFFLELQLFNHKTRYEMESKPVARTLDEFVADHPAFFESPHKRAAFNMGCLVELLLRAQYEKIKSQPFLQQLQGLNLDEGDLRKIFPRLLEKISQYEEVEKFQYGYVQKLRAEIVPALMMPSEANRTEISFAFTAGMVMQKEFTQHKIDLNKAKKAEEEDKA